MPSFLKIIYKKSQNPTAQGMVEFALVLPVLLMLILGIFAFGHVLFTYSMIVAASREAARYGIATGISDSGIPRFRDCDAIRTTAMRVGGTVGVKADDVTIAYDRGPNSDGTPPLVHPDGCPIGGVGPGYLEIADRIVITIDIDYQPIVPLGGVTEFPLRAVTRRTLIRTMPIGNQPIAPGGNCAVGTITRIIPPAWYVNGVDSTGPIGPTVFQVEVIADQPSVVAPGTLELSINDPTFSTTLGRKVSCGTITSSSLNGVGTCNPYNFTAGGTYVIRGRFISANNNASDPNCFADSVAPQMNHIVP